MEVVKKGEDQDNKVQEEQQAKYETMHAKQPMQPMQEKLSYEQLENIAHQLSEQVKAWMKKAQENELGAIFQRLDYLFRVVSLSSDCVFPTDFVERCAQEIEDTMFPIPEDMPAPEETNK